MAIAAYAGSYELDFERPLLQLERQINELEQLSARGESGDQTESGGDSGGGGAIGNADLGGDIRKLRQSHTAMLRKIYAKLGAWHTVKVARHPGRPQSVDYLRAFVKDFCELHGDRRFGDDPAILAGFGRIGQHKCMVIAHNKGRDTKERIACHFGCAHPEGYRKALRCMKLAQKFGVPVVTLVDTPGAYPGVGAEERGQAEAIAVNLMEMSRLKTPIVSVIIGEGGSGGALGIAVADRVAMMQYAWYSVISPEGCAAILWKTGEEADQAAEALKLTAADNLKLGTVDHVIEEPLGGAHRNPAAAADRLEKWIISNLRELKRFKIDNLLAKRSDRLRHIGQFEEAPVTT
jgi:acetyl-CoA carboxylase carboxyl transferase subunit alpha